MTAFQPSGFTTVATEARHDAASCIDFVETQNFILLKSLLKTEKCPEKRRVMLEVLAELEAARIARIAKLESQRQQADDRDR